MQASRVSATLPSTEALSAARRVLESPSLVELRDAVTAPMTLGRFVGNIGRAWGLTFLRIASDPEVAEREMRERVAPNIETTRIPSQISE